MKVSAFIEWLKTQPQDATVCVLRTFFSGHSTTRTSFVPLDVDKHVDTYSTPDGVNWIDLGEDS